MEKKIIIANWKMNPQNAEEALRIVKGIAGQRFSNNVELVIAPPFIYLDLIKKNCGKEIKLAAQNAGWAERGAYTGEISSLMLKNLSCDYVIIGHSERRYKMGETEEMINLKIKAVFKTGLTPILAVGEKGQNDDIIEALTRQVKSALEGSGASEIGRLIVAYEPVWAIGTGLSDTSDHALSAALLIRKIVGNLYGSDWAKDLPVLYGGSVSGDNARDFIGQNGINGALVGGASLELDNFIKIIKAAGTNE
ncbi:triose-phosphate isomerase [Candidatus Azambacteria bacterium]|nr:triose-phosphate isomerase [Candidatus Azambacteria bacterium]